MHIAAAFKWLGVLLACGFVLVTIEPARSQSPEQFYGKKPLKVLIGTDVGGSYDLMGRLMARHIAKHIPGHPAVVVENMPGGGSMVATNHLYNVAPQDGSVLGAVVPGVILNALFKDEVVRFDVAKMQWVGNAMDDVTVVTVFHTSPYKSLEEAKQHEITMGAGGISSFDATNILLINALLGTKFHLVQGYKGGEDINLALERGEVQGRGSQAWSAWKAVRPDWVKDNKLIPLVQLGLKPLSDPKLKDVPLLIDIVSDDEARRLATVYSSILSLGRPMVLGPDVPKDRVAALRLAFVNTVNDPSFLSEAKNKRVDIGLITGEDMQAMIIDVLSLDLSMVSKLRDIIRKPR